jgi:MFS transporter, MHS family, shikimate and dehydroshikimate transport protein
VQAGVPVGLLLANAVFMIVSSMDEAAFLSWGWRVPFLLGVLLLGVGMFIRLKIIESPVFTQAKAEDAGPKVPILAVLRDHPRNVLLAMGARFAENAFFYIFTVLVLSYGSQQLGMPKTTLLNAVLIGSAVQLVVIPCFGALSDRHWTAAGLSRRCLFPDAVRVSIFLDDRITPNGACCSLRW